MDRRSNRHLVVKAIALMFALVGTAGAQGNSGWGRFRSMSPQERQEFFQQQMDGMTDEQRAQFEQRRAEHEARRAEFEALSPEEQQARREAFRAQNGESGERRGPPGHGPGGHGPRLTEEERAALESMTEEERHAFFQQKHEERLANMTDEERQRFEEHRQRMESMTEEERQEFFQQRRQQGGGRRGPGRGFRGGSGTR